MLGKLLEILTSQLVRIDGSSMEPTFRSGAWVVVSRRAYSGSRTPERFDVVRFEDPDEPARWLIKRIVGLPNEEVEISEGRLVIDGNAISDAAGVYSTNTGNGHQWWPREDEYVVLGDNRSASRDSRKFGSIPARALTGKVVRRLKCFRTRRSSHGHGKKSRLGSDELRTMVDPSGQVSPSPQRLRGEAMGRLQSRRCIPS